MTAHDNSRAASRRFGVIGWLCVSAWPAAGIVRNAGLLLSLSLVAAGQGSPRRSLTFAERADLKTLNPLTAVDGISKRFIQLMTADLVHIDRQTRSTRSALAERWTVSPDGRKYTVHLRRGVRFSDGHPFDADDVVFTFAAHLDPEVASPQRDLLVVHGKPIEVRKQDSHTVTFAFVEPYAPGERVFDSIAILPRHLLENAYRSKTLKDVWQPPTPAGQIAGLGPFRLREHIPGQRLVLERNPHYWRTDQAGRKLPLLETVTALFVGTEDTQALRFRAGETDLIERISAKNFEALQRSGAPYHLDDLGPSQEYNFLFFNLNDLSGRKSDELAAKQSWFLNLDFRRAVSLAIDRAAITRLVYRSHGTPLWWHVTPGNPLWENKHLPKPGRSVEQSRKLLQAAGFSWNEAGKLRDSQGRPVAFSLLTTAGNNDREQMATLIQADMKDIGIDVSIVSMGLGSVLDRVQKSRDFEACLLALDGGGDTDPAPQMNVWLTTGGLHVWDLSRKGPHTTWQAELDRLMTAQLSARAYAERKQMYDRVQEIVASQMPIIALASPNVLVGIRNGLNGFRPGSLPPYALSNLDEVFWSSK